VRRQSAWMDDGVGAGVPSRSSRPKTTKRPEPVVGSDRRLGLSRVRGVWTSQAGDSAVGVVNSNRHVGSGMIVRSAVSPRLAAHAAKNAARRWDTILASLQGHPATRQARRPGRSVASWRSIWMSISRLRFAASPLMEDQWPNGRREQIADASASGPFSVRPLTDLERAPWRRSPKGLPPRRAATPGGYDEAAPEGGSAPLRGGAIGPGGGGSPDDGGVDIHVTDRHAVEAVSDSEGELGGAASAHRAGARPGRG